MAPRHPANLSYMRGWFLVKYGDPKRAAAEARRYVALFKPNQPSEPHAQ